MLRYLVVATPLVWAAVMFLIWRHKSRRAKNHSVADAQNGPRAVSGSGTGRPLARVIPLYPRDIPAKAEKNPDEK